MEPENASEPQASRGSPGVVFRVFLKLGVTSFGGPIAHLGYFRDEFVVRRKWIDEAGFVDLVALCQFSRDRRPVRLAFRWAFFAAMGSWVGWPPGSPSPCRLP